MQRLRETNQTALVVRQLRNAQVVTSTLLEA